MSLAVRSMRAMDVLLWLGVVCSLIARMFTVLIIGFGAKSARPPDWDERLREAAHAEVHRRGLDSPPLSRSDLIACTNLIGTNEVSLDPNDDRRFLAAVAALTDAPEEQLESLKAQRARILAHALERQTSAVKDITDHRRASWVWQLCTCRNTAVMIISGIRWFLPLFFIKVHHIGDKYLSAATLLGVWIGLLWWGASHFNGRESTADWLGIVSAVITLSTVLALMAIIGRQLYAIRTALYDPASQLNLKYISAYVITIIILLLFFVLAFTGVLSRWEAALNTKTLAWLDNIEGTVWTQIITFAIGAIIFFYALYGVLLWARTRVLRIGDRIAMVLVGLTVACLAPIFILFSINAPRTLINAALWVFSVMLMISTFAIVIIGSVRLFKQYLKLRAHNIHVPRKGFRLWALATWVGVVIVGPAALSMVQGSSGDETNIVIDILTLIITPLAVIGAFAMLPGLVITGLYLFRIRKFYREAFAFPSQTPVAAPDHDGE